MRRHRDLGESETLSLLTGTHKARNSDSYQPSSDAVTVSQVRDNIKKALGLPQTLLTDE